VLYDAHAHPGWQPLFDLLVPHQADELSECRVSLLLLLNAVSIAMQIIALANLRTKATHSAQTVLSHFRRDGDSQTWQPKTEAAQTKVLTEPRSKAAAVVAA
jgi:hypothetical protein